MHTATPLPELSMITDDLKHRLLCTNVMGVHIAPSPEGLVVGGRYIGQESNAAIRRCCDEVSRDYSIDISVKCLTY